MEWVRILRRLRDMPAYMTDPTFRAYVQSWGQEVEKDTQDRGMIRLSRETPEDFLFRLIEMQCEDRARLIQQHLTTLQNLNKPAYIK